MDDGLQGIHPLIMERMPLPALSVLVCVMAPFATDSPTCFGGSGVSLTRRAGGSSRGSPGAVRISSWLVDSCGRAGSLTRPVADVRGESIAEPDCLVEASMRASEVDDFFGAASSWHVSRRSSRVPLEEVLAEEWPEPFCAARPRTSSAISEAVFFLPGCSSSEERLDDMMVSSVPTALLFLRAMRLRLRADAPTLYSSSAETTCRVGP